MSGSSGGEGAATLWAGRSAALISALWLGCTTTLAWLVYDAGGAPMTLVVLRFIFAIGFFAAMLRLSSGSFRLPRQDYGRLLVAGLAISGMTLGYMSSVAYIPVSLAALIFFTFPLMIAALTPWVDRMPIGPGQIFVFVLAFAGLAMTLGPDLGKLDWRGVAWALFAAVSITCLLFQSRTLMTRHDPYLVLMIANLVGLLVCGGWLVTLGQVQLPSGTLGFAAFILVGICYILGVTFQFLAVRKAGPADSALFMNLEPVVSVVLAMVVLGEELSWPQLGGISLVLAALVLSSLSRRRMSRSVQD